MAKILKSWQCQTAGCHTENSQVVGTQNGAGTLEDSLVVPCKVKQSSKRSPLAPIIYMFTYKCINFIYVINLPHITNFLSLPPPKWTLWPNYFNSHTRHLIENVSQAFLEHLQKVTIIENRQISILSIKQKFGRSLYLITLQ